MKRVLILFYLIGCSNMNYKDTVDFVDLEKYQGDWYVMAARPTYFEKEVHNGIETYHIDGKKIKIKFSYRKGDFNGPKKEVQQSGEVYNEKTNAHWKVSPLWPLKFDFLVIALADDYSWTAVGVPSGKYLWVMSRDYEISREQVDHMLEKVKAAGYPIHNIEYVPHDYTSK